MSGLRGRVRRGALGLAGFLALATPSGAFAPGLEMLKRLEPGRWQVRNSDTGSERQLCLGDASVLTQLEHRGLNCPREVLTNSADEAIVQYSCPGRGFGHTSVRFETPRLAQIETQGLIDGRPFAYRAVAKKIGSC